MRSPHGYDEARQDKVKHRMAWHGKVGQGSGVARTSDSVWDEHLEEDLPQLSSKMRRLHCPGPS